MNVQNIKSVPPHIDNFIQGNLTKLNEIYDEGIKLFGDGIMSFVKFASKGNSIRFGDLTFGRRDYGGGGNSVRGLYCGGAPGPNTTMIEYITIASEGNGTVFGDLTVSSRSTNCCDSQTRTVIIGRSGPLNTIDFVTIATTGNAVDFGDDILAILNVGGSSDSHGGLGGFLHGNST